MLWLGCGSLLVALLAAQDWAAGQINLQSGEMESEIAGGSGAEDQPTDYQSGPSEDGSADAAALAADESRPIAEVTQAQTHKASSARELKRGRKQIRRTYRVTAYADRGITAAGVPSGVGQCAAPEDIPFGSEIYIPALGRTFVVTDRTAERFRHNTVDVFMPSSARCRQFGRRYHECVITLPDSVPAYGRVRTTVRG